MNRRSLAVCTVAAMLTVASTARADEVILKNGDRMTGKVTRLADGALTLQSELAGEVKIAVGDIRTFSTDEPIEIHFQDGTVVNDRVVQAGEGEFGIEAGEVLQAQTFSLGSVADINPPPPTAKWSGSVNAGVTITRGNTDTQTAFVRAEAMRRGVNDRIKADAEYVGSRQRNTTTGQYGTTERRISGGLQYDYFFSKKAYGYANARAEKDGVKALDLRFTTGVGGGYQWIEEDDENLSTEAGVAWFSESYSNATPDVDTVSARVAAHYDRQIREAVKFIGDVEWYPGLENGDDHFITAVAALRSTLAKNLFAEARVEWDYDNTPAVGAERIDVRYILSLGWAF